MLKSFFPRRATNRPGIRSASVVLILTLPCAVYAQESDVRINDTGKSIAHLKHTWSAKWITHPSAPTREYGVFLLRRSFELDTRPSQFIVYVSADNRYRLFVNGAPAGLGPARGDMGHYRYETLDIAKHLRPGRNVIAAEVVNFGEHRHAAQQTFQTAFILQSSKTNSAIVNTGDGLWRIVRNDAYQPIPFSSAEMRGYFAAGPGDRVDAELYPWGWQQPDFDDGHWLLPRPATVEFAVGRGFLYGSTWFLVPRTIPFLEETVERIPRVARSVGIDAGDGFLRGVAPLVIPPNTRASLLLDQTHHTIGYPELTISGGRGGKIKLTYAEALYDESWNKGNRNEIAGKQILGYYDVILPDGGERRVFKPLAQRTYRFIQMSIETADEALQVDDYHSVYTAYPFQEQASFGSDDPMLDKIWDVSWRTLRNSAVDGFIDPYYEQMQYVGDARIEALVSLYVSGDDRLMRKAIEQFDDSRLPGGLTQSRYPAYIVQVIPPYSLLWIGMIHDYYMYGNDMGFPGRFLPGVRGVLEWFERRVDQTGLPGGLEWWNFVDWSAGFKNGIPPGADDGHSALVALQYVMAAQQAADLFDAFGWDHEARKYRKSAEDVRQAVHAHCFDRARGMIAETPEKKQFSQHTQGMAVLTDTVPTHDQPALMEKVLMDKDLIQATIYFRFYVFRALQKAGMGEEYLDQLGPWKTMIGLGLTTFAETDDEPRSECHAWSASPNFDLLHTVAGIQPAEPGFRSVTIAPNLGPLDHLEARLPHPDGAIEVEFRRTGEGGVHGRIVLPGRISGTFRWRGETVRLRPGSQEVSGASGR